MRLRLLIRHPCGKIFCLEKAAILNLEYSCYTKVIANQTHWSKSRSSWLFFVHKQITWKTSLKVNSVLEREPNLPILTSIFSNLIYLNNSSIQYYNYEKLSKLSKLWKLSKLGISHQMIKTMKKLSKIWTAIKNRRTQSIFTKSEKYITFKSIYFY